MIVRFGVVIVIEPDVPSSSPDSGSGSTTGPSHASPPARILHHATDRFVSILTELRISLLVSTYQAGKLAVVQTRGEELLITYHNFERPMGIAVSRDQIAIGTNTQVWFVLPSPQKPNPAGGGRRFDTYWLVRGSHFTGEIHGHEMEWSGSELWVANTLFSCLCTIRWGHNFVPRWKPSFVTVLAAEDRCHLNGLGLENGRPRFVTCLGESDTPRGWKEQSATGGCLIDVNNGQFVLRGLCMPHSPRVHQGQIWFIESGRGHLMRIDPLGGKTPGCGTAGLCAWPVVSWSLCVRGLVKAPPDIEHPGAADRRLDLIAQVWRGRG